MTDNQSPSIDELLETFESLGPNEQMVNTVKSSLRELEFQMLVMLASNIMRNYETVNAGKERFPMQLIWPVIKLKSYECLIPVCTKWVSDLELASDALLAQEAPLH